MKQIKSKVHSLLYLSSIFQQKSNQMRYKNQERKTQSLSGDKLFDCHDDLINYGLSCEVSKAEANFFASSLASSSLCLTLSATLPMLI
jgi:hypothetical protein